MQNYDRIRKRRGVDPRLPPGARPRRSVRERAVDVQPDDRKGTWILISGVVLAAAIPAGIYYFARGPEADEVARNDADDEGWRSGEEYLRSMADAPAPPLELPPETITPPERPAPAKEEVVSFIPPPEPSAPVAEKKKTSAAKAALFAKKRQTRREIEADKPAKKDGENRYFTLDLSGKIGGETLDPEDSQTWARLSYFLREESRRPHFLVFPNGSVPVSVPDAVNGKPAPRRRAAAEEIEPGGDPAEPAYRLVIRASASEGQGVTFMRQRLASTYRCSVTCRVDRRVGDSWKTIATGSAEESINPQSSGADAGALLRTVYHATIEKLTRQLADKPPFGAALAANAG